MENFVRDYGTGSAIPDPPVFVNYTTPDALPSSSSRPTSRPAQFTRASQRPISTRQPTLSPLDDEPLVNTAGIGAGGGHRRTDSQPDPANLQRSGTQRSARGGQVNGTPINGQTQAQSSTSAQQGAQRQSAIGNQQQPPPPSFRPPQDPHAEPIDPTADTYIKVGSNAYKVDLSRDPQQSGSGSGSGRSASVQNATLGGGGGIDPLAKQMEDLKNAAGRRNSTWSKSNPQTPIGKGMADSVATSSSSALSPPAGSSSNAASSSSAAGSSQRDYRNSAEIVVGGYPGSRPASPNPPPTATFMLPPSAKATPPSNSDLPVEDVVADYQQSFPGERRQSVSRSNSHRRNSFNHGPGPSAGAPPGHTYSQSQPQILERATSRAGHPGIGAHGSSRSNSPVGNYRGPPPSGSTPGPGSGVPFGRNTSIRATSPNPVGVALDPNGRVIMDSMAERYRQQQQQQQQQYNQPLPVHNQAVPQPQRQQSYLTNPHPYGVSPTTSPVGPSQPPVHAGYVPPPPPLQQPPYNPPPQIHPNIQQQYPQSQVYQPQPQAGGGYDSGLNRNTSHYGNGGRSNQPQMQPPQPSNYYRGPSPAVGRSPSPQPPLPPQPPNQQGPPPTGQTTEDGRGILFYGMSFLQILTFSNLFPIAVKALYDYSATIDEEFDFQSGDIIAVTATPEDGWWSGELLDEARRQPGRHVFPSNFVCLF
jgi:hypothetical protein